MPHTLQEIAATLHLEQPLLHPGFGVQEIIYDSRKLRNPGHSLFVALTGDKRQGLSFIPECYAAGIRAFLVPPGVHRPDFPEADFLEVNDPLAALQSIAAFHRHSFTFPVIAITGSNGKTMVKEWLYHLLKDRFDIVRSPKSFNSQLGVPLSVWQMAGHHTLGIFEAGISHRGEMQRLEPILHPDIGILTNIGTAHDEGFGSSREKLLEKLLLFRHCHTLVYCADQPMVANAIKDFARENGIQQLLGWSLADKASDHYLEVVHRGQETLLTYRQDTFSLPFADAASVENAAHCLMVCAALQLPLHTLRVPLAELPAIDMRLQMKKGVLGSQIINDSYSADLTSLQMALDFLHSQAQEQKKMLVLSDLKETGKTPEEIRRHIAALLRIKPVDQLVTVGRQLEGLVAAQGTTVHFPDTESFLRRFEPAGIASTFVLLKGARDFRFERIARAMEESVHETVLEINLLAVEHNYNYFRRLAGKNTRLMCMVKAYSYGSGSFEIASLLQYLQADYLAVAYADEGIALRKLGISLPMMVMNPQRDSFEQILEYGLEPDIYDLTILQQLITGMHQAGIPSAAVHLEFDTGMHRLGFTRKDVPELLQLLRQHPEIRVQSVFAHLAASDEPEHDNFTRQQVADFTAICRELENALGYAPLFHIANTTGILRFPEARMDMVRLGIGLYGIDPSGEHQPELENVATLKTQISQIRSLPAGETVGYGRKGKLARNSRIAVIAIGYADGLRRSLGNGVGKVYINGKLAPVVGNICMDMTMVDVTDIECREGEEVIVFGTGYPITEIATQAGTIPYEILTSISSRVKRVYWRE